MDKREVLLLNASEEILGVVNWKRAIKLLESGKATRPINYKQSHDVRTTKGVYKLPAAIVLIQYVRKPRSEKLQPTRKNVFRRDDWTCQYCGFRSKDPGKLTIDHVHPRSRGGDSGWTNLTTACAPCNIKKANKLLKESKMKLANKPKKPKSLYALRMVGLDSKGKEMWGRWIDIHIE